METMCQLGPGSGEGQHTETVDDAHRMDRREAHAMRSRSLLVTIFYYSIPSGMLRGASYIIIAQRRTQLKHHAPHVPRTTLHASRLETTKSSGCEPQGLVAARLGVAAAGAVPGHPALSSSWKIRVEKILLCKRIIAQCRDILSYFCRPLYTYCISRRNFCSGMRLRVL